MTHDKLDMNQNLRNGITPFCTCTHLQVSKDTTFGKPLKFLEHWVFPFQVGKFGVLKFRKT